MELRAVLATGKHATVSVLAAADRSLDGDFLGAVLDPVPCEELETTALPLLHPSYREVWFSPLGYTRGEYAGTIRGELAALA